MDGKALAKSKRAHSQRHNKKFHPNQTKNSPSVGTGPSTGHMSFQKQVRERSSSSLPSNWERYNEENDLAIEDPSHYGTSQTTIGLPKSKGANYAYLISEAKSQPQKNSSLDDLSSFDDVLDDLNQGLGSFLCARGQSISSWIEDDDFLMEDNATASCEVPFLTLNLHNLAKQLANVDLARRLFIESDLLQAELFNEETQANGEQDAKQIESTDKAEAMKNDSGILHSYGQLAGDQNAVASSEMDISSSGNSVPVFGNIELKFSDESISHRIDKSISTKPSASDVSNQRTKTSTFQAAKAEAELDMLLDTFNETSFFPLPSSGQSNESQENTSTLLVNRTTSVVGFVDTQPSMKKNGSGLSNSTMLTKSFEDELDDLLDETSNTVQHQNVTAIQPQEFKTLPADMISSSTVLKPDSKSKLLEDFDSWLDTI